MKKVWLTLAVLAAAIAGYFVWRSFSLPAYGWLVFGPEGQVRMIARVEKDAVHVDLNRNGRFETAERFPATEAQLSIPVSDGETSYVIKKASRFEHDGTHHAIVDVDVNGKAEFRQHADLSLSRTRSGASIAHFNGPMEIQAQTILWELPKDLALTRSEKGTDMRVNIGTIRKAQRCWTTVYTQDKTNAFFPTNVFPWVEVRFPASTNGPALIVRYPLDKVC